MVVGDDIKMKFYHIAIVLFLIHVSIPIVNYLDLFDIQTPYASDWIDSINQTTNSTYIQNPTQYSDGWFAQVIDASKGLFFFIVSLAYSIVWIPKTMSIFGLVKPITYYLSAPIYMIYILAIAQWVTKYDAEN